MMERWKNDDGDFASEAQQRVVDALRATDTGYFCSDYEHGERVLLVSPASDRKYFVEIDGRLTLA